MCEYVCVVSDCFGSPGGGTLPYRVHRGAGRVVVCRRRACGVIGARSARAGERRHITGRSCFTCDLVAVVLSILERKKEVCVVSCRVLTRYRYDRIASAGVDAWDAGRVEIR